MTPRDKGFRPPAWAGLAAAVVLAYLPSLRSGFVADDLHFVAANPYLLHPSTWWAFFVWPRTQSSNPDFWDQVYRPVASLSLGLNAFLGGLNPFWFHATNILLHAGNAVLIFLLLRRLGKGTTTSMLLGAGAFALHPAHVSSVAYVSGRSNLLCLGFGLAALLFHDRAEPPHSPSPLAGEGGGEGFKSFLPAYILTALALLSKEAGIAWPLAFPLWDYLRRGWGPRALWERRRRYVPYLALGAGYTLLRAAVLGRIAQTSLWGQNLFEHVVMALKGALVYNAAIVLWPAHLRFYYGVPTPLHWGLQAVGLGALCAFVVGWTAWAALREPERGFSPMWFLLFLAPVSNIVPFWWLAGSNLLYLPMAGLAFGVERLVRSWPPRGAILVALLLVVALLPSHMDFQLTFANDVSLITGFEGGEPPDYANDLNLAHMYGELGMLDRSAYYAQRVLQGRPDPHSRAMALAWLGLRAMRVSGPQQASVYYRSLVKEAPEYCARRGFWRWYLDLLKLRRRPG